jgi:hypothetical protein
MQINMRLRLQQKTVAKHTGKKMRLQKNQFKKKAP